MMGQFQLFPFFLFHCAVNVNLKFQWFRRGKKIWIELEKKMDLIESSSDGFDQNRNFHVIRSRMRDAAMCSGTLLTINL